MGSYEPWARLAAPKSQGFSCLNSYSTWISRPAFYVDAGDLNSNPDECVVSLLPTEQSDWPGP